MKKILSALLLVVLTLSALTSCASAKPKEKVFSIEGMKITLTDEFVEKQHVSYTAYYETSKALVVAIQEEFSMLSSLGIDTNISLKEYAELVISSNKLSNIEVKESDGLVCFEHEKELSGKNYVYFSTVYKANDAFWLFQFACEKSEYDSMKNDFIKWAKSVEV